MSRGWRITIVTVAMVAVLTGLVVQTRVANDRLAAANGRRAASRDVEASLDAAIDRVNAAIQRVKLETDTSRSETATDRAATVDARGQTGELTGQAQGTYAALVATSQQLQQLRDLIEARGVMIADLQTCIHGVLAATSATETGNVDRAVAELSKVTDACERAQKAAAPDGNIVFPFDFPDPSVVWDGSRYYAYATNSAGGPIQLISSTDLATWQWAGTALHDVASWGQAGATWAPAVARIGGSWLLYYAVRDGASGRQCISVAHASSAAGPFVDTSASPLVCDADQGGSIDPSPFVAPDGRVYLLWKSEGETVGGAAQIRAQQLSSNGQARVGAASVLLDGPEDWEGSTIEAPSMASTSSGLVLLYSGNSWNRSTYATGAARCDSPLGPCNRTGRMLATSGDIVGPGGASMFTDGGGRLRVAYHAWCGDDVGYPYPRYLHIGAVQSSGGQLGISG